MSDRRAARRSLIIRRCAKLSRRGLGARMAQAAAAPKTLFVATEARVAVMPDGQARTSVPGRGYEFWTQYLYAFDNVVVIARGEVSDDARSGPKMSGDRVSVCPIPSLSGKLGLLRDGVPGFRLIFGLVRRHPTSVFLGRMPGIVSALLLISCRLCRRDYGVELVGDPAEVSAVLETTWWGRMAGSAFARLTAHLCRRAPVISYVTARTLQEKYPKGDKATGFSASDVVLEPRDFKERAGVPRMPATRLIMVGTLEQVYKGHHVALNALHLLAQSGDDCSLTIVGSGRLLPQLAGRAAELGMAERVFFVGRVDSRRRILEYFDEADIFLMPSLTEGLPRALLEAMARGLPCVASSVGGVPELLHRECLVEPNDPVQLAAKIRSLRTDARRLQEYSLRNTETARLYAAGTVAVPRRRFIGALRDLNDEPRSTSEGA